MVVAARLSGAELAAAKTALSALHVSVARSVDDACRLLADRSPEVVVLDVSTSEDADARIAAASAGSRRGPRVMRGALGDPTLCEKVVELARLERAERVAAASAARLHAAQALGESQQFQHDPEARTFTWLEGGSARFESLRGAGAVHERFLSFVHPEDRGRVEVGLAPSAAGPTEYRLVLPSGEQREVVQDTREWRDPVTDRGITLGTLRDVTEERQRQRTLAQLAHYDAVTGLPNRAHVSAYVQAALDTARRHAGSVAVVSVGVDAFRVIEETFGRDASEAVLLEVASRLQASLADGAPGQRGSDGLTARHGPHELVVVLRDASAEDAAEFFRRASARLAAPIALSGTPIVITCSAGVVVAAEPLPAETLLAHADAALYAAKAEGRARLVVHAQKMRDALDRKRVVEQRLRESLASGVGLELHYQPKVETRTRRVKAVEALLRSSPDARGPISPLELVSVAEECGLVHTLGDFVLRAACEQARVWAHDEARPLRVAVNISAHQLARAGFADQVAAVLAETGLRPDLLELEITEGSVMKDIEGARHLLAKLKALGVRIALDDFGTGYSSLAYLTRLPIDTLKIDRSFVLEIGASPKGEAVLSAVIALSQSLGLEVVAEGVETAAQQAFLARHAELEIQGWLYSKALPARELLTWLDRHDATRSIRPSDRAQSDRAS